MNPLKNDRFMRAIYKQTLDQTPIWIMRQAGRYLPEYQAARKNAGSFLRLCQTPELAAEVTLQPLRRFSLDAAIIFSDILTIPDAMGLGLQFIEGFGPRLNQLQSEQAIHRLAIPDFEKLSYVYEAIRLVQQDLKGKLPLIGFCGSPWTLAAYMIDGDSKSEFKAAKKMLKEAPSLLHHLLNLLAYTISAHLNEQIKAGVQAVMLFDSWGGLLQDAAYKTFSLSYMKQVMAQLIRSHKGQPVPVILFTKGGTIWLHDMAETGCDVIGVDWEMSLGEARAKVGSQAALQGNMNPKILLRTPEEIEQEAEKILASYGMGSGHIFNLGHGITPDVPPEHLEVLIQAVHEKSRPYHEKQTIK